jgi:hypothetical protein
MMAVRFCGQPASPQTIPAIITSGMLLVEAFMNARSHRWVTWFAT